ncbi:MAG TPA: hypothetical protein PLB89_14380, partial [Flavobacteriales bacterium]|nr:hypothetical protein [Flavobacteriales bacterium]
MNITSLGSPVTQNFNGMGTTATTTTTSTLPAGFKVSGSGDWSTGATTVSLAGGTSGSGVFASGSTGGAYNMANGVIASSTDRSLGFLTSGSFTSPRSIVLKLHNGTGAEIGSLDLAWNYEKSRNGTRAVGWTFFHGNTVVPAIADGNGDFSYAADANNTGVNNPPLSQPMSMSLTGLLIPAGADYYLRWTYTGVGGSSNAKALSIDDFTVTANAPPPPANDECVGATYFGTTSAESCSGSAVSDSTTYATASGGSCSTSSTDVWYYFYSTSTTEFVNLSTISAAGMGIEVFDACGGNSVYCASGNQHQLSLTQDQYYYMRVFTGTPGRFTLCVSVPVGNDECANGTYLGGAQSYGSCTSTLGTTMGSTPSGGSCGTTDVDVWYYFSSGTGSASFIDLEAVTASGLGIEVFDGACGGTSVYCGSGLEHTVPTVAGQTYYLRVFSSTAGEFSVCVSAVQPNDECSNPTYLGGAQAYGSCSSTPGTTAGSTPSGGSCGITDVDVWYYFSSGTGNASFVDLEAVTASGLGIEVFDGACGGTSVYCGNGLDHTVPTIAGQTYYLRVFSGTAGEFSVCVSAVQPNDECSNPTYLGGAQAFGSCISTPGTTSGSTPSGGSCGTTDVDVWYYFSSGTGSASFVDLEAVTASGLGIEIFDGACGGTSVYCGSGLDHTVPTISGQTYYMRVFSIAAGEFTVCISAVQPNDECANPTYLGGAQAFGSCISTPGTTSGSTPSGGSCGTTDVDVWYYFSSGTGSASFVDLEAVTASGLGIEIFDGACGGTSVYCGSGLDHTVPTISGQTYYMRVFSATAGEFSACVSASQPNDECINGGLPSLTNYASGDCPANATMGTTAGSTPSGGACGASSDDVWYYFYSGGSLSAHIQLSEDGATGLGIEVYNDDCTIGQSIYCGAGTDHTVSVLTNLYYLVRVYSTVPGGFGICVSNVTQPGNDECAGAQNLGNYSSGDCPANATAGTTIGASPSGGACGATDNDVWYYFYSGSSLAAQVDLSAISANGLGIEVFEAACGGTSVYCSTGLSHGVSVTPGQNYWMRVYSTTPGEFTVCVSNVTQPGNDDCTGAQSLGNNVPADCPTNATTGTTIGASPSGGACGATDNDVWYYFYSGSSLAAQVDLSAISANGLGIEVFEAACGGTSVYCSTGLSHGVSVTPGQNYWMRVYSTTPGEFTVCVSNVTQPGNDDCTGAQSLGNNVPADCPTNATTGTTIGASPSGGACGATDNDVWYYFYSGSSLAAQVDLSAISANGLGIEVFEAACGGTSVYCSTGLSHGVSVTPGQNYWMRVYSTTPGEFTVCVSNVTQPGNDDCTGAQSLGNNVPADCPTNATTGTTIGASPSGGACGATDNDVWYYFYSGSSLAAQVDLSAISASGLGIEVFEDACGGTSVYCASGISHGVAVTPAHNYWMRVYSTTDGEFTVCVSNVVQPGNDDCTGAQSLGNNVPGDCPTNATTGTTIGASPSGGACGSTDNDVWYYFYSGSSLAAQVDLSVISASGMGIEVFEDACGGTSVYCGSGLSHGVAVTPAHNYWMRVYSSIPGEFTVCVSNVVQPGNDDCTGAQNIGNNVPGDCPTNATTGTTIGASASGGSCGSTDNDVWYYFYSGSSLAAQVQLDEMGASGMGIEVFEAACGGTSVYCGSGLSHGVAVTPDQYYWMRVYSTTPGEFTVCVSNVTQPANDECAGSGNLGVYAVVDCPTYATAGTTLGGSSSGGSCGTGTNDVWYYFSNGSAAGTYLNLVPGSAAGMGVELYPDPQLDCSGSGVYCANGNSHLLPTQIGPYYRVRVFASTPGDFTICLTTPPTNDECAAATGLSTYSYGQCPDNNYPGSTLGATASGGSCSSSSPDVWYSFYSHAHAFNYVHLANDGATGLGIEVFDACGGASVYCGSGNEHLVPVTPNTTMYMRVFSTTPGGFQICVNRPPDNDDCAGAVTLNYWSNNDCVENVVTGTTVGATFNGGSCGSGAVDVWYSLYGAWGNGAVINLTSTGATGLGLEAFDACGGNSLYCGTGSHHVVTGPNTWTYLRVFSTGPGGFNICTTAPATNNECSYAAPLTLELEGDCPANAVTGSTVEAGLNGVVACSSGATGDVWYQVYSGSATAMHSDLASLGAGGLGLEVFDACGGNSVYCANGLVHEFLVIPGTSYYLKVHSTTSGAFTICATQADGAEDCLGVPGGPAIPGSGCDDLSAFTINDQYQISCDCQGYDCVGVLGGTAGPGTPCSYPYAPPGITGVWNATCGCDYTNCAGEANAWSNYPGTSCDDGDPLTINETWDANCDCTSGTDCAGVVGGTNVPGAPCSYPYAPPGITGVWNATCGCDYTNCAGEANAWSNYPGTSCDDGDPLTINETWDANCDCTSGTDCAGVVGGTNVPGAPCSYPYAPSGLTGTWSPSCQCEWIDCEGNAQGSVGLGAGCDDGDECTIGDVYDANCNCAGSLYDSDNDGLCDGLDNCPNTPGVSGAPCDDGNPNTAGDVVWWDCGCRGLYTECSEAEVLFTSGPDWVNAVSPPPFFDYPTHPIGDGPVVPLMWGGDPETVTVSREFQWNMGVAEQAWISAIFEDDITIWVNGVQLFTDGDACLGGEVSDLNFTNLLVLGSNTITITASSCGGGSFLGVLAYSTTCTIDCAGVISGTAYLDNCGTCVGGNTGLNPCIADCNGVFGGTAYLDNCGTCVGGNTGVSPCTADCNGVFGGTAYLDNCGTCVGGNTGVSPCTADCNGVFGGTAYLDNCGTCVGGNTGVSPCTADCNGVFGGTAFLDNCAICVGGNTGLTPCTQDCNNDWGGTAYLDNCNVCVGGTTGMLPCEIPENDDCSNPVTLIVHSYGSCPGLAFSGTTVNATMDGIPTGSCASSYPELGAGPDVWYTFNSEANTTIQLLVAEGTANDVDWEIFEGSCPGPGLHKACGDAVPYANIPGFTPFTDYRLRIASGVQTGTFTICLQAGPPSDCFGVPGGTAYLDNCGTCVGGNTGLTACVADCNGDFGGTAFLDNCSICVGGNTGLTACVADCNGDYGGTAFLDNCAICVGGNTGLTACTADCNGDFGGTAFLDNCAICVGGNTGLTA